MANKRTRPLSINLDDDIRQLSPTEARNLLNLRAYSSTGAEAFALEGILSNVRRDYVNSETDDFVVGVIPHEERNDLYIFVWNERNKHKIVRYNSINDTAVVTLESSLLELTKTCHVQGFAITSQNPTDTLLYWNDGVTQPKKINATRAFRRGVGDFVNGYPETLTSEEIRWIKYQSTSAPTFTHGKDPEIVYNNLKDKVFQFKYRYVHKDGERSAYSPISDVTFSEYQLRNGVFQSQTADLVFNFVNITVENKWNDITKIEVIAREGNDGTWLLVETLDNEVLANGDADGTQSFRFSNDRPYRSVDQEEANKVFDAVPLQAVATEYINNRALIGNAVDGYDSLDQDLINTNVTFGARYLPRQEIISTNISLNRVQNATDITITAVMNALTVVIGDSFFIDFRARITDGNGVSGFGDFYFQYTAAFGDTISDVVDFFASAMNDAKSGDLEVTNAVNTANDLVLTIKFNIAAISESKIIFNDSVKIESYIAQSSFKAAAKHPMGVIYEDEAGRNGTVQRPEDNAPYVKWFSDRGGIDDTRGATVVDWRVGLTPPIWAKKHRIVYGGNSSVGKFIQYSNVKAYINANGESKDSDTNLYIPFHTFKGAKDGGGHEDSYRESTGAIPDYQFAEGDRLRIISFVPQGTVTPVSTDREYAIDYLDFKVVDFQYFEKDVTTNPIYNAASKNNWGWTLVLEDPQISGWSHADVKTDDDDNNWFALNTGGTGGFGAFFEIYNSSDRNIKDVFFETSQAFDIGDAGLSTRFHKGFRDQGVQVAKTIESLTENPPSIEVDFLAADPQYFVGDKMTFSGGANPPSGIYTVADVRFNSTTGFWVFTFEEAFVGTPPFLVVNIQLDTDFLFAGGTLKDGDVWLKPRRILTGTLDNLTTVPREVFHDVVEDYYANDFFVSNFWNKGRIQAFSEFNKQETRKATIWISETYFPDTNTNGFSSFNLAASDSPFRDYDRSLGSIQKLVRRGDELIMYQENKVSRIPVGKESLRKGDGGEFIVLTGAVLAEQVPYAGDYGIAMNPESFAQKDGSHYFVDIKRGKALRLSADGLTPISDYKISKLFDQLSRDYMRLVNSNGFKIYGGYDREHDEYNITFSQVITSTVSVDGNDNPYDTSGVEVRSITDILVSDLGQVPDNLTHSADFDIGAHTYAAGEDVILDFQEKIHKTGDVAKFTDWLITYKVKSGDSVSDIINGLGALILNTVQGDTKCIAFANVSNEIRLSFQPLVTAVLIATDIPRNDSRRVIFSSSTGTTSVFVVSPSARADVRQEMVVIESVDTLVDIIDFDTVSTDNAVYLNTATLDSGDDLVSVGVNMEGTNLEGKYDIRSSELIIPESNNGLTVTSTVAQTVTPITIVFHERSNTWVGFRSYTPNGYAKINYTFLSFNNGEIWKHDSGTDFNKFFGSATAFPNEVGLIFPVKEGVNKVFNSLSIESNKSMDCFNLETNIGSSSFDKARFDEREGIFYADLPKFITTVSTKRKNVIGVGVLGSQNALNIVMTRNINELGLTIGDAIHNATGDVFIGNITAFVDEKTITLDANPAQAASSFLYAIKTAKVEGDAIRGIYLRADMRVVTTEFFELFGANTHVDDSYLTLPQK